MTFDDVMQWAQLYGASGDEIEEYVKAHRKELGYSSDSTAVANWNTYNLEKEAIANGTLGYVSKSMTDEEKQVRAMASDYLARTDTRGMTRVELLDDLNEKGYSSLVQQIVLQALGFNISDLF
jgi:hypothetical protein